MSANMNLRPVVEGGPGLVLSGASMETVFEVSQFYASYARTIDARDPNAWVESFLESGLYAVGSHNNVSTTGMWWYTDRGVSLLKERAAFCNGYAWHNVTKTLHTISNVQVYELPDGSLKASAYMVMYAADRGAEQKLHVCAEYDDVLVRTKDGLRFAEHRVIVEAETVPANMMVLL